MDLPDSFGIRNTFLVVPSKALRDTYHIFPTEHVQDLTLVDPECSPYSSQDVSRLHCVAQFFYLSSCSFYIISTSILNAPPHSFPS